MKRLKEHRFFLIILLVYGVLAVGYSFATPPYETPDESYHVGMIFYIAAKGELPIQHPDEPETEYGYFQEASQPPLYYFIQAQLIQWTGAVQRYYPPVQNPHAAIGVGLAQVNQRVYLPNRNLDVRVQIALLQMRWFSILLGGITLSAVYFLARAVFSTFPKSPKTKLSDPAVLLAVAFVAFNPMFIFIHSSITNDTLATTLATVGLALLFTQKPHYWLLAILLALGAITKLSVLTLYPVVGGVLLIQWLKGEISLSKVIFNGGKIAIGFALLAAWWYLRNRQLYHEFTGTGTMIATIGGRPTPYTVIDFFNELQGLRISGWALFGWLNVIGPEWFLIVMDLLTVLGLVGGIAAITWMLRSRRWDEFQPYGILGAYFLIIFLSLINWTRQTPGTQGRLLFPAIGAVAVLMALGWRTIFTLPIRFGKLRQLAFYAPVLPLFTVAALSPILTIIPAYREPPVITQVPSEAQKNRADFGAVEILGATVDRKLVKPGESLTLTLYYHPRQNLRILSLFITIYDCQKRVIGKIDSTPGRGNLSSLYWDTNAIYQDRYQIPVEFDESLCQPLIEVGWYETFTKTYLSAADGRNTLLFRSGAIQNTRYTEAPPEILQAALFSETIQLHGYTLSRSTLQAGTALSIRLNFESTGWIYEDFTVFVHLQSAGGKLITTGDAPPKNNDYPTTSWIPTLPFNDDKTLVIPSGTPSGTYWLSVGFYRSGDQTRLPVNTGGDTVILNTPIEVK